VVKTEKHSYGLKREVAQRQLRNCPLPEDYHLIIRLDHCSQRPFGHQRDIGHEQTEMGHREVQNGISVMHSDARLVSGLSVLPFSITTPKDKAQLLDIDHL
jgi:hypothetical protein